MNIFDRLNFKDEKQREIWEKVIQDVRRAMEDDLKNPERFSSVKSVNDFWELYSDKMANSLQNHLIEEMPFIWTQYIEEIDDESLKSELLETSSQQEDDAAGWSSLPNSSKRALLMAAIVKFFGDFMQAIPENARQKIMEIRKEGI